MLAHLCVCLACAAPAPASAWEVRADIPIPQFGCSAAVIAGNLHVIGGVTLDHKAADTHQVYDPAKNAWAKKAPPPDRISWPAIAVHKGKIYVFGGDNEGIDLHKTDYAWVYDPAKDVWSNLARLPNPRSYAAATAVGDSIYIFGNRTLPSEDADRTTYRYDPAANTYKRTADLPEGARFITQAHHKGSIYAVHGETDKEAMADGVLKYDIAKDVWVKLPIPRIEKRKWTLSQHSASISLGSRLFILGGKPAEGPRTSRATFFDMERQAFGELPRLPVGRCCGSAGVIDGTIFIAGGFWIVTGDVSTCKQTWSYAPPR